MCRLVGVGWVMVLCRWVSIVSSGLVVCFSGLRLLLWLFSGVRLVIGGGV